jgi:biopolymer transport protein TolR
MRTDAQRAAFSEINVTPLVDVMLVLLIIFMIAAPLLQQGIQVRLPKAQTSQEVGGSAVMVTLTKEHVVYLNDEVMTLKELRRHLGALPAGKPVIIRADRYAYVDKLMELWDLCREAGLREIHIATLTE